MDCIPILAGYCRPDRVLRGLAGVHFVCPVPVEEAQRQHLDVHSRFAASMSVAARDGFIHRPVVDEWGLAFAQAIKVLVPGWRPSDAVCGQR